MLAKLPPPVCRVPKPRACPTGHLGCAWWCNDHMQWVRPFHSQQCDGSRASSTATCGCTSTSSFLVKVKPGCWHMNDHPPLEASVKELSRETLEEMRASLVAVNVGLYVNGLTCGTALRLSALG